MVRDAFWKCGGGRILSTSEEQRPDSLRLNPKSFEQPGNTGEKSGLILVVGGKAHRTLQWRSLCSKEVRLSRYLWFCC